MSVIRCIDLETTGLPTADDKHAVVEIGACDVLTGDEGSSLYSTAFSTLIDPGRPIPHEAMAVHHITDDMVKGATGNLDDLGTPDYFAAHVADFERQFIPAVVPWICTYKVALRFWPDAPAHNLQFLRYHLGLEADSTLAMPPHRAGPDAYLCSLLMERILAEGKATIEEMVRWSDGPALLPRVNFGKHKGSRWEDVPLDYLDWVANKSDLDRDIKANAKHWLKKRAA